MKWIILLLIFIILIIITRIIICIKNKITKRLWIDVIILITSIIVVFWYFTPMDLQLTLTDNKSISIPMNGEKVLYLNQIQKDELIELLNQLHVRRDFFSRYNNKMYDSDNLITIFISNVDSDMIFVKSGSIKINISLDENGFKYIPGKSGFIEFISNDQVFNIEDTEKLRAYIKRLML